MTWRSRFLTLVTLSVLFLGIQSILLCTNGRHIEAALLIITAAIVDALDGSVARRLRSESGFGARLDSYVDVIGFGVAPAILLYESMWKHNPSLGGVLATAVASFAVLRFARGAEPDTQAERHRFRGLPIPVTGMWIALFVLMNGGAVLGLDSTLQGAKGLWGFMAVCTVLFLFLQISNVPYTKPGGKPLMIGLAITAAIMHICSGHAILTLWSSFCVCSVLYAILNPFCTRHAMLTDEAAHEPPVSFSH